MFVAHILKNNLTDFVKFQIVLRDINAVNVESSLNHMFDLYVIYAL